MRDDLYGWHEIEVPEKEHEAGRGKVRVRATKPVNLIVTIGGVEVLAGSGHEVAVTVQERCTYRVEPVGDNIEARVWVYEPMSATIETRGVVHSNADRKPMEVGHLAEVRKELRLFQLQQKALRDEIRRESQALEAKRRESEAESAGGATSSAEPDASVSEPDDPAEPVEPAQE